MNLIASWFLLSIHTSKKSSNEVRNKPTKEVTKGPEMRSGNESFKTKYDEQMILLRLENS